MYTKLLLDFLLGHKSFLLVAKSPLYNGSVMLQLRPTQILTVKTSIHMDTLLNFAATSNESWAIRDFKNENDSIC